MQPEIDTNYIIFNETLHSVQIFHSLWICLKLHNSCYSIIKLLCSSKVHSSIIYWRLKRDFAFMQYFSFWHSKHCCLCTIITLTKKNLKWETKGNINRSHGGTISWQFIWLLPRTTDAQRGNSLHCTAENSIPIPNF